MSRNLKRDYILKIMKIDAPNGYKFDLANYLHNPSYHYDYPSFIKEIAEDQETITMRRVYYFKYYNGTGEYREEIYKVNKSEEGTWHIVKNPKENMLEESKRFNINKLLTFC